jgi:rhomboid protease GluP
MAVGLTPKYIEAYSFDDLPRKQFLALAVEAAINKGWKISYMSENGFIAHTTNGMFSWNAEIKLKIEGSIANIQSASTGNEMIDLGRNKKNVASFISALKSLKENTSNEQLEQKYFELKPNLVSEEDDILKLPPLTTTQEIKNVFSIFVPTQGFFVTPVLINLNILIFVLMVISGANILSPDTEILLKWGANLRAVTLAGQWWRVVTCCFLHIGIFHLLMNMYALLYIGVLLEPRLGRTRFIAAYLLTGVTASIASLWWHDLTVSAGASGAIFGMYGVFLALLTTDLIEKSARQSLLASIVIFVAYNLLYGIQGNIDNAAHIGGLVGGLVIGYAYIPSLQEDEDGTLKFGTVGGLVMLVFIFAFFAFKKIPNDIGLYNEKMKHFTEMESMALEIFKLPPSTPNDKILSEIKNRGIYYWNENINLIDSFDNMNLPEGIKERNKLIKEYCELRIQSYQLLYVAIAENTNLYKPQLDSLNTKIEEKMSALGVNVDNVDNSK